MNTPAKRRPRLSVSESLQSQDSFVAYANGYDLNGSPKFKLSYNESQGFQWNQDWFASRYQQDAAGVDNQDCRPADVHDIVVESNDEDDEEIFLQNI